MATANPTQIVTRRYSADGYLAEPLVPPGTKIYGVLVDWVDVPTALRFGTAGGPIRVRAGDFLSFPTAQDQGVFLFSPAMASPDASIFCYRFTFFLQPVGDITAHGDPWARAMEFQQEIEVQPVSGANAVNIGFGNLVSSVQQALLGAAFSPRAMRLESLAIESSATGRVGIYLAGQFPPPIPFSLNGVGVAVPIPLGLVFNGRTGAESNFGLTGGCVGLWGEGWDHGGESLLFHPPVEAGVELPISDLALEIARGAGIVVVDETVNTTLRVTAAFKVLQLDLEQRV